MANTNLNTAKSVKDDEFYTRYEDIENEIKHYTKHFENKIVFCNCDDPEWSNFWKYFCDNFDKLGLKKLISTHYEKGKQSYKLEYDGSNTVKMALQGNGDFRSDECVEILKSSDIVATNPPFSLFRQFIAQLIKYKKDFLIIGNKNAATCKEIFPLLMENKVWFGCSTPNKFITPSGKITNKLNGLTRWFSNIDNAKRHTTLKLTNNYKGNEVLYPKYDNYDAINVNKVKDIPKDYKGVMGVPITFLDKYNPEQFKIIGNEDILNIEKGRGYVLGKRMYSRVFVKVVQ